jgi:predicted component of type VI protein secretion system
MIDFLLLKVFPPLAVAILLVACSSAPKPPPPLVFDVTTATQTNNGGLFYFVVRSANEKQFMLETYQDVANKAFSDPPDQGVLGVFSVVPGTQQEYTVNQPAQGTVALYFLLTKPGSQWKKLFSAPLEDKYNINLKANSQVEINKDKPWYSWF